MQIKKFDNNRLNSFWDELQTPLLPSFFRNFQPSTMAVNVYEEGNNLVVEVSAPGVSSKDKFDISLNNENVLTVSVEDKHESESEQSEKERVYHIKEISSSARQVSVALPAGVNPDSGNASYDHGVLKITFDKTDRSAMKKIQVG